MEARQRHGNDASVPLLPAAVSGVGADLRDVLCMALLRIEVVGGPGVHVFARESFPSGALQLREVTRAAVGDRSFFAGPVPAPHGCAKRAPGGSAARRHSFIHSARAVNGVLSWTPERWCARRAQRPL
jgi:hypothetical protein